MNGISSVTHEIDIEKSIAKLSTRSFELEQYKRIMQRVRCVNVSSDINFQREFNYFYKIRRNKEWRNYFYNLFEKCKIKAAVDFSNILHELYAGTQNVEASFSSKMLATLNPKMPIWDSIVISRLGLKQSTSANKDKRLYETIETYAQMVSWYDEFLGTRLAEKIIGTFNCKFPQYVSISEVKKIDFVLWAAGI